MPKDRARDTPRQLWLVPDQGQAGYGWVADVAAEVRTPHLYSYAVPDALREQLQPGVGVRVPYGRSGRLVDGVCVRLARRRWEHTLKPVAAVTTALPVLTENLLALGLWVSEYYACPPGPTLATLVPAAARRQRLRRTVYLRCAEDVGHGGPTLQGTAPAESLTAKQQRVLAAVGEVERRREDVLSAAGVGVGVVRKLIERGLLAAAVRMEPAESQSRADPAAGQPESPPPSPEDAFVLTAAQEAALAEVCAATGTPDAFCVFLLFGVPGSGKTEVYVRAIRQVVAAGRQAILLVPEIALATQVVDRLARRFARVAVWHSRLPAGQRRRTFSAIRAGQVDVVIGTRSAVFAPCTRLGLIVVDEEQDDSFKSLTSPLYHARDVAIKRGQIERVPLLLGSATPALETWHNATTLPHYRLLRLPERVAGARLPEVRLVQTRSATPGARVLSPELIERLSETLQAGQQAILLHNRRGYAVYLRCARCGLVVSCPRCGGHMVFHQVDQQVRCHRCAVRDHVPAQCLDDTCAGRLERVGLAIQRLHEELARGFPEARLLRLDSDTMRRRQDYETALAAFEAGEADILLGTQMVAKGLDFPRVRLVGVVEADFALALPDFRASEQVFQLVTQVVGRAGRREGPSAAIVQCTEAGAPVIRYAVRMDYESFARQDLAIRRRFFYPPFCRMVRAILADRRPNRARAEAEGLATRLRELAARLHPRLLVSDAEPCAIPRLRRRLRYQVLVRGPRDAGVRRLLREAGEQKLLSPRVERFSIDVDPVDLL